MAHKAKVKGTVYEITDGKTKVDGTGYDILVGKTQVKGTEYDIQVSDEISVTVSNGYADHSYPAKAYYETGISEGNPKDHFLSNGTYKVPRGTTVNVCVGWDSTPYGYDTDTYPSVAVYLNGKKTTGNGQDSGYARAYGYVVNKKCSIRFIRHSYSGGLYAYYDAYITEG